MRGIIRRANLSLFGFVLCAMPSICPQQASADYVTTTAYINLLDGPYTSTSNAPNTSVSSQASAPPGASSSANADTGIILGAVSSSTNVGLTAPSVGSSGYESAFNLVGVPNNTVLPLSFNFNLHGSLSTQTLAGDFGSVALASIDYTLFTSSSTTSASYDLLSQAGISQSLTSGTVWQGGLQAQVLPFISVGGQLDALTDPILVGLGIDPNLSAGLTFGSGDNGQLVNLSNKISGGIFKFGLPQYGLPEGYVAQVGFNVNYTFNGSVTLSPQIIGSDFLGITLVSQAHSSVDNAIAMSNYADTFDLTSITVPNGYNGVDISGVSVNFDSGLSMPVTMAPTAAPEPSSLTLLGVGMLGLVGYTWRWRKQQSVDV